MDGTAISRPRTYRRGGKETCYEALQRSSQNWHEGWHDVLPWTEYLLGTVTAAGYELVIHVELTFGAANEPPEDVVKSISELLSNVSDKLVFD